jgi:EAL domain-containing protein (putative c-di-GMP-specific phosphodiesterase class I)
VVHAIVEMGRALNFTTVVAGVDTATELRRLQALGCVLGQGRVVSPVPTLDAMADLVAHKRGPSL